MAQVAGIPREIDRSGIGYDLVLKTSRRDVKKNGEIMACEICGKPIPKGTQYYNKEWRTDYVHFTQPVCLDCALGELVR